MTTPTFPPRVWVNPKRPVAAWTTDESKSLGNVEYLSLTEHQAALDEKDRSIAQLQNYATVNGHMHRHKTSELEAKLTQSMEALEKYTYAVTWHCGHDDSSWCDKGCGDGGRLARETLATLKSPATDGKDGIGWCPNGLDDSPADDPWRK